MKKAIKILKEIVSEHIRYKYQLRQLAKSDMKKQYSGSMIGIGWALIKPAIVIFVFWFALTFGLRTGSDKDGHPFFLWLIAGMIPWFYMRDMITGGAMCIRKYKFLVNKIKYPVTTIPTIVSLSNLVPHIGLVAIMSLIFMAFGYWPTVYYLQLPLYTFMMFMFFQAWGLFAGTLSVVSKDFLNLVKSLTQAVFWMSGILYDIYDTNRVSNIWIRRLLMINPVTMIVNGYRNVFTKHIWFWERPKLLLYFLVVYSVMLLLGVLTYGRLRKDIPDML